MKLTSPPEESEWIEAYLDHKLEASERAIFEAKLSHDDNFREEVALRRLMHEVIDEYDLRAEIAAIHAEKMGESELAEEEEPLQFIEPIVRPLPVNRPAPKVRPLWWRSAAAVAAAGGLWVGYLSFDSIAVHEETTHVTRGGNQPSSACYSNYYAARQFLVSQQPDKAIPCLEQVVDCEVRPYFKDASKWFLAVACLQSGQTERAGKLFEQIKGAPDFQYEISALDRWKMDWQLRFAGADQSK